MIWNEITHDNLPAAISQLMIDNMELHKKLDFISKKVETIQDGSDVMDVRAAAKFLNKTVPAIYALVHKRRIKFYKPTRDLQFIKSDLIEWAKGNYKGEAYEEAEKIRNNVITLNKQKHP